MKKRCFSCLYSYDSQYDVCPRCGYIYNENPIEPYHLLPGTILNERYIIGIAIGHGGFGTVYRAWDNVLNIDVAIKEFYPAGLSQRVPGKQEVIILQDNIQEYRQRISLFIQEATIISKFRDNPNIVNVMAYFELNNTAYIVMEYLEGLSLSKYLEINNGKVDVKMSTGILLSVINALKVVHKEGIIHRDISPSNIFLCNDGKIKLIDFGAAKFVNNPKSTMEEVELKPGYAPPEQYRNNIPQGIWTDIYSLGATAYKTLTGEIPMESVDRQLDDKIIKPSVLNRNIPSYFDRILLKAMSLEPELRFKSVNEFENAILKQSKVRTPEQEIKRRKNRRMRLIISMLLLILFAGISSYIWYRVERLNEVLPKKTLQVWMIANNENEEIIRKSEFDSYCEEFLNNYPQITIEYSFYDSNEYNAAINKAALVGKVPDIFEANDLTNYELSFAARKCDNLIKMIDSNDYYVLGNIVNNDSRKIPIGMSILVPVYNVNKIVQYQNPMENSPVLFNMGVSPVALLDLQQYFDSRESITGSYRVVEKTYIDYSYEWCLGWNLDYERMVCSDRLMYYLLSDQAQKKIYESNYSSYLPVNKSIMRYFIQENPEFSYILDDLETRELQIPEVIDADKTYNEFIKENYDTLK